MVMVFLDLLMVMFPFVLGLEYLSAARSLHPELHAGSTLASQDFQLSLEGKEFL